MSVLAAATLVGLGASTAVEPQARSAPDGYESLVLSATVRAGQACHALFTDTMAFRLVPIQYGWEIEVREDGRDENLAPTSH